MHGDQINQALAFAQAIGAQKNIDFYIIQLFYLGNRFGVYDIRVGNSAFCYQHIGFYPFQRFAGCIWL